MTVLQESHQILSQIPEFPDSFINFDRSADNSDQVSERGRIVPPVVCIGDRNRRDRNREAPGCLQRFVRCW